MSLFKEREKCTQIVSAVLLNVNFSQLATEISVNLPNRWKAISKYYHKLFR